MSSTVAPPRAPVRLRPAVPRWWSDLAGVLAGLTLLVVTALWVHDGGPRNLTGAAAGRLTGLWASDLLLLQVLLMARIPLAERAFGQDRLARWHRRLGFGSFWLMVAHIALISAWFTTLWDMVVDYPGMLLAAAGTALILLVVVTSVRGARRRLRYESWHLLHLYAYLGVGLALPHQLWTGTDFVGSPVATAYWWTLWAVAAGAVLAYRILLPAWRNGRHRLVVSNVVAEGPGLTSVYLRGRRLDRLPVRAGQFFLWRFLDGPGWSRAHPYSLSTTPTGEMLRITVKDLGDGSRRVAGLRPGTRAIIEGPYGRLTGEAYAGGPVLLLACGIGVTPLLALLGELAYGPGQATLLYRARSDEEMSFRAELRWFAEHRGVRVVPLLGPRAGRPSWVPAGYAHLPDAEALRRLTPEAGRSQVYVCGPDAWTAAVCAAAREVGVPPSRLHTEQFAW